MSRCEDLAGELGAAAAHDMPNAEALLWHEIESVCSVSGAWIDPADVEPVELAVATSADLIQAPPPDKAPTIADFLLLCALLVAIVVIMRPRR